VFRGSAVLFPDVESYDHATPQLQVRCVRHPRHATTFALEEAVAQLEGGHAHGIASGLAAIVAALMRSQNKARIC